MSAAPCPSGAPLGRCWCNPRKCPTAPGTELEDLIAGAMHAAMPALSPDAILRAIRSALEEMGVEPGPAPAPDAVNHPPHYRSNPSGVECITVVEHMGFNLGNAVKYIWRAGQKENAPTVQDLRKAVWYIEREIAKLEKEKP